MTSRSAILKAALCTALIMLPASSPVVASTTLIPTGAEWKYLDDGSDQGVGWRAPGFADTAWASGPAQLGYGDGDEATVVSYGPSSSNKYVTTYFRHAFEVADPGLYPALRLRLLRDDGAVVYLNGVEVRRSNMPDGPVTYMTLAEGVVGGEEEDTFQNLFFYPTELSAGANVLAVEIHQQSRTSSDISFDMSLIGLDALPTLMRKKPYLVYPGVNTEMDVHWQLSLPESCTIEWGLDTSYSMGSAETGVYGSDYQHTHTITGLNPGTLYFYRVTAGAGQHTGSFRAAPPSDAASVKFFAYGDCRTYPASHDVVCRKIVEEYVADPDLQTVILSMGDLISDGDREVDWDDEFFTPAAPHVREMMANLPYQSCMGNHEEAGILFEKYFPYPFVADRYWSFDYGPVHFAVVDQYVSYSTGSPQLVWLENDLASTAEPWKIVYLHEPGWSAGGHANNTDVQTYIQPLLIDHGVTMLFAGHNHYYARAVVNDIHHVTTGGAGAPLYTPNPAYPNVVAAERAYHYCTVEIDSQLLHYEAIDTTGAVIDSFTVAHPTAAVESDNEGRDTCVLGPASPNPFTTSTSVSFALPHRADVRLEVFDINGRKVKELFSGPAQPGKQSLIWDGTDETGAAVSPGAFFYRLRAPGVDVTRKVVRLR